MQFTLLEVTNNSSNTISSFLTSLVGAFIGTGTALLIFILEGKRDKKKANILKEENQKNDLIYFKLLLETIVKLVNVQSDCYKEQADSITNKPFQVTPLKVFPLQDLDRILHKTNHAKLLQAYLQELGNTIENIKEFKNIISYLDFIEVVMLEVPNKQKLYTETLDKSLLEFKELFEENILKNTVDLINTLQNNDTNYLGNTMYTHLNSCLLKYYQNVLSPNTLEYIQSNLITPLLGAIVKNFIKNEKAMAIANDCRRASWLYKDIIFKGENFTDLFNNYYEEVKKALSELEKSKMMSTYNN